MYRSRLRSRCLVSWMGVLLAPELNIQVLWRSSWPLNIWALWSSLGGDDPRDQVWILLLSFRLALASVARSRNTVVTHFHVQARSLIPIWNLSRLSRLCLVQRQPNFQSWTETRKRNSWPDFFPVKIFVGTISKMWNSRILDNPGCPGCWWWWRWRREKVFFSVTTDFKNSNSKTERRMKSKFRELLVFF